MQSKIGTGKYLGPLYLKQINQEIPELNIQDFKTTVKNRLGQADAFLSGLYNDFYEINAPNIAGQEGDPGRTFTHDQDLYAAYWFHPDHPPRADRFGQF